MVALGPVLLSGSRQGIPCSGTHAHRSRARTHAHTHARNASNLKAWTRQGRKCVFTAACPIHAYKDPFGGGRPGCVAVRDCKHYVNRIEPCVNSQTRTQNRKKNSMRAS